MAHGGDYSLKLVRYSRAATRTLDRIPANEATRIQAKVNQYAADPRSLANNVKALKGSNRIRLRVGDWRVLMEDDAVIEVVAVGPRGSIYD